MFINRLEELKYLKSCYHSEKFECLVIYGRRRVGKSRLILESIKQENAIYFLATEADVDLTFHRFKRAISEQTGDTKILDLRDDYEAIFNHLVELEIKIVVIDEFPYLISTNKSIKSIFQSIIDLKLSQTSMTLILMGSSISIMEDEVLGSRSPLYGRRTGQIKIQPFRFIHLLEMFPNYSYVDLVMVYATLGGMPYYLIQFDPLKSFWTNLTNILNPNNVLFEEVRMSLLQELREISTYSTIIQHIATGNTKGRDIKNRMNTRSDISPYLKTLERLDIIEKRVPVTENQVRSRNNRYYLKDQYFTFWFQYVAPNQELVQIGGDIISRIKNSFSTYVGHAFEVVVKQLLSELLFSKKSVLPFSISKLERWWYKEWEIDLIGLGYEKFVCVEIKWQTLQKQDIGRIFLSLQEKSDKTRLSGEWHYIIVAKSTDQVKLKRNQYLFDLETLVNIISEM